MMSDSIWVFVRPSGAIHGHYEVAATLARLGSTAWPVPTAPLYTSQRDAWKEATAIAASAGKKFPTTTITVKGKASPAIDDARIHVLENQRNILELFPEPSYEQLFNIMNDMLATPAEADADPLTADDASPSAVDAAGNTPTVEDQFDKLFDKN
jgi:hypothetical protein